MSLYFEPEKAKLPQAISACVYPMTFCFLCWLLTNIIKGKLDCNKHSVITVQTNVIISQMQYSKPMLKWLVATWLFQVQNKETLTSREAEEVLIISLEQTRISSNNNSNNNSNYNDDNPSRRQNVKERKVNRPSVVVA